MHSSPSTQAVFETARGKTQLHREPAVNFGTPLSASDRLKKALFLRFGPSVILDCEKSPVDSMQIDYWTSR